MVILVADDERIIADTLAEILKQNGFDATAAYSGEDAIQKATFLKPDMLITDVTMGQISGIEAALRIQASLPRCRVILFSGHATTALFLDQAENQGRATLIN